MVIMKISDSAVVGDDSGRLSRGETLTLTSVAAADLPSTQYHTVRYIY